MATKSAAQKTEKHPAKKQSAKKQLATKPPAKNMTPAPEAAKNASPKPTKKPPAKLATKPAAKPVAKPAARSAAVKLSLVHKIVGAHLLEGRMVQGAEVAIGIDQTLTQDATGTMVYLQLEAMGIQRAQTEISVSYIDHHLLQTGFENADDHRYLQTVAAKYGVYFSRPGNGICHQVHLERFAAPGKTVLGCDSNASMLGAMGCFALGGGGMDVALAMCGEPLHLIMPQVVNVVVKGQLGRWASAKDVILELLRRLTIRGGAKRVFEYSGDGLKNLSLPERATIANMGAELGATSSIFPSDANTQAYLRSQKRANVYRALAADRNCQYDEQIELNLRKIEPLVAQPSSPDNVIPVRKLKNIPIDQILIGSTGSGAFEDLATAAEIMKKSHPPQETGVSIIPSSRQVLQNLAQAGHLEQLIQSGARILECSHGPSAGLGQAPASNAISLRTFNRNYGVGDSANNAKVYLCSAATAAASALTGKLTDPRTLKRTISIAMPKTYLVDDAMIVTPPKSGKNVEVVRGPNIKKLPTNDPLADDLAGEVLLRMGENVATNHMLPSGPTVQLLRSNIPAISKHLFENIDASFSRRAKEVGGGFLVAGDNYGQGPSHEHAALAAMFLGVKAVLAKSFARIHRSNLINYGIIPLTFVDPTNYDDLDRGDRLEIPFAKHMLTQGKPLVVKNLTKHKDYNMEHGLSPRQCEIILAGGLLNFIRQSQ